MKIYFDGKGSTTSFWGEGESMTLALFWFDKDKE